MTPLTPSKIQVEVVSNDSRFLELGTEWNRFLEETNSGSIFMTWEYLKNWWEVYGHNYQLQVILVRNEANELIGIAPLMIGRGHTFPRKAFRHLTFIGGLGDSLSEYQDFLIRPGHEKVVFPVVIDHLFAELRQEWDLVFLPLVKDTSSTLPHLVEELPKRGCHLLQLSSRPAPYIPLPGSWEEFIKLKSKNFKKQFNNQWNRLHKKHQLEWVEAGKDLSVREAMNVISTLNRERWGKNGNTFKSSEFNGFHGRLAEAFAANDWLYLRLLKVDGKFAAARYDFLYGDKLWNYQNGWLPELAHLSLGKMMIGDCLKWCIGQGLKEYDFLAGDTEYKRSWATQTRQLITIEVSNPLSRKALAFEQLRRLKNRRDRRKLSANARNSPGASQSVTLNG